MPESSPPDARRTIGLFGAAKNCAGRRRCPLPFGQSKRGDGMTYRVIQWASGGVGRAALQGVLAHPDLDLVGCWVHSPEKDGVDLGTLLSGNPIGVGASCDVDALLAVDADCVLYSPIFADPSV